MSQPTPSTPRVEAPRIVMLGPPGSGKGTHARLLAERLDIPHMSTGSLLRREIAAGSPLGRRVEATVNAGQLVDDATIVDLVRSAIASLAGGEGWILDGAPRSIEQAQLLADVFEAAGVEQLVAIALEVPEEVLRQRLLERGKRRGRADDAPEVISERFEVWAATGPALLTWYEQRGMLEQVDGTGSIEDVASKVAAAVDRRFP